MHPKQLVKRDEAIRSELTLAEEEAYLLALEMRAEMEEYLETMDYGSAYDWEPEEPEPEPEPFYTYAGYYDEDY